MWVKEYPWVYIVTGQEWAYVHPSATPQIWDRDTWQEGNSSLFSDHGWVWMYNPNFGYSNKSNQWIHFTGHDSNSTFLYSASNNQWYAWDNYNKVSITLDPNDLRFDQNYPSSTSDPRDLTWNNYNKSSITLEPDDLISFEGYLDFSF